MVAFLAAVIVDVALIVGAMLYLRRRPKGTPLTWGEAFAGATYIFAIFYLSYAMVPHQFITMCDKDFGWRSDVFGIPTGPFWNLPGIRRHNLWPNGVTFFGRGRLMVNEQTVRDTLVTNIYGAAFTAHFKLFAIANRRGDKGAEVTPVSPYGRPLVRKA
ncbi:MAG TPA: hypothetical protein VMZ22_01390 [Acidimicrobiales bacterium]|nr:hypothetical protein [Acidimicrobiales bacterium]